MINLGKLHRAHQRFAGEFRQTVDETAQDAANYEQANAKQRISTHARTGKLSTATNTKVVRTASGRIVRLSNQAKSSRGVGYASYIDKGNGTGYIYPRRARFLRFRIGPLRIFARRVRAYRGSLAFTKARQSGFLYAGFLLRTRLAVLARKF